MKSETKTLFLIIISFLGEHSENYSRTYGVFMQIDEEFYAMKTAVFSA